MNDWITITELRQSERGALFMVYSDRGFECSLSAKGLFETDVRIGSRFTEEEFESVREYASEEKALRRAVYLLGNRAYGSQELLKKLESEGENGQKAVDKLLSLGYLDDDAYADSIIAKYAPRYGVRRVAEELKKRLLAKEIWEDKLSWLDQTEDAYAALCGKAEDKDLSDRKEKEKIYAFLVRRGYTSEDICAAFRRYGEETDDSAIEN